jgi:hypothetical protein
MFIPCDAMLYFYLLLGQSYYQGHQHSFQNNKFYHRPDHIITNQDVYDINDTLESVLIKEEN